MEDRPLNRRTLLRLAGTGAVYATSVSSAAGQNDEPAPTVYVGTHGGVYAIDAATGEERWTAETERTGKSSPTVVAGTLVIGSERGTVYAVDAGTGEVEWEFTEPSDWIQSSPTVVDGTVYIGSRAGTVYAIDADAGTAEWEFTAPFGSVPATPAVVDGTVYVSGMADSSTGALFALETRSGEEEWRVTEPAESVWSSPTVADGTAVVGLGAALSAVDVDSGTREWTFTDASDRIQSSPTVVDGTAYVGSQEGTLHAVDVASGREEWSFQTPSSMMRSSPTVADGTVFAGTDGFDADSAVYAVDAESGAERWAFDEPTDRDRSSPAVFDGTVYVGGGDDTLYALDAETGSTEWEFDLSFGHVYSSPTVVANPSVGSSVGSRVLRGTLGHHQMRRTDAGISVPVELHATGGSASPGGRLRLEFGAVPNERRSFGIGFELPEGWEIAARFDDGGRPGTAFDGSAERGWTWRPQSVAVGDEKRPWVDVGVPDDEAFGTYSIPVRGSHAPPERRSETTGRSPSPPRTTTFAIEAAVEDPTAVELDVTITETSDPVREGESLEVTAEIENAGNRIGSGDARLLVGADRERVDTRSVTVPSDQNRTITLAFEPGTSADDRTVPIRVETDDAADERAVLIHGTNPDRELAIRPGTRVRFEADVDQDREWTTEWHLDGEHRRAQNPSTVTSVVYYDYVDQFGVDYWSHEFESTGTREVTAYVFPDPETYESADYASAAVTRWTVNVTTDGMAPPSVTDAEPDTGEPIEVGSDERFELGVDVSSPDSELDRAVWYMSQADVVLEFQRLDGHRETVTLSVDGASCHTCGINVRLITVDGLTVSSDFWELDHEAETE